VNELHDEILAIVYKHLQGKHDQKTHGRRFGFGNSIRGAGWYHSDMTDKALKGVLMNNNFQRGEIEAHRHFSNRIKRVGLKLSKEKVTVGDDEYERYIYVEVNKP